MNSLRAIAVLFAFSAAVGSTRAQGLRQQYVGKSPCAPELQTEQPDFSLRLDKVKNTTLLYRDLSKTKIVMIVEPTGDTKHCGVIRDLIQITHIVKNFEFRCFDPQAPNDVIIGTTMRNGNVKRITAIDAWRIDLKKQEFVETKHKVTCSAEGWDGADDRTDMVDEVKKYAAHTNQGNSSLNPNAENRG